MSGARAKAPPAEARITRLFRTVCRFPDGIRVSGRLLLLLVWPLSMHAADPPASQGQLVLTNLASAPFPHSSRTNGHHYSGQFYPAEKHYQDNRVAIAIPAWLRPGPTLDFVVHFHGWHNNVTNALRQFALQEQLEASQRPAILVLPEGPRDAPDSSGGRLEEPEAFARLMSDVLRVTQSALHTQAGLGRITLSGHSGGYRVIGWILHHGGLAEHIQEVFLFDAIYAQTDHFLAWVGGDQRRRLVAIYTNDGGTLKETRALMRALQGKGIAFQELEDQADTPSRWPAANILFLHTDLEHNDVMAKRRHFERFLRITPAAR